MPGRLFVCVHACAHLFVMYAGPPCAVNNVRIDTERERGRVSNFLFHISQQHFIHNSCLTQLGSLAKMKKIKNKNVLVVEVYESHSVVCVHVLCVRACVDAQGRWRLA